MEKKDGDHYYILYTFACDMMAFLLRMKQTNKQAWQDILTIAFVYARYVLEFGKSDIIYSGTVVLYGGFFDTVPYDSRETCAGPHQGDQRKGNLL